jgi:hypothetical protein
MSDTNKDVGSGLEGSSSRQGFEVISPKCPSLPKSAFFPESWCSSRRSDDGVCRGLHATARKEEEDVIQVHKTADSDGRGSGAKMNGVSI